METIWRTDFDICAIILLITFTVLYYSRKRFPTLTIKLYEVMVGVLFVAAIFEYIENKMVYVEGVTPRWLMYGLVEVYMCLVSLLTNIYGLYVFLIARQGRYTSRRWYWVLGYTPAALVQLAILTTSRTGWIFYFEGVDFFEGPLYIVMYLVDIGYMLFAAVSISIYRNNVLRKDRLTIYAFLFLVMSGMAYQSINMTALVTTYMAAIALVVVYFAQQSNYEKLDSASNLYNRLALSMYMNELVNLEQHFYLMAVTPDNLMELIRSKGTFYGDGIIAQLADRFKAVYSTNGTYTLGSGRFVIVSSEKDIDQIEESVKEIFAKGFRISDEVIEVTASGCGLEYPGHFESVEDALELIEKGLDIAAKAGNETFVTMENYELIRDSVVTRMSAEQRALTREKQDAERARVAAEQADKAKSIFLAHMSHEIRTPLTTILGMTEILLRGDLNDEARSNAEDIYNAGGSLLQIINDILDFSKIEAGKFEIVQESYNVVPMLDAVVNVLRVRCDSKPIQIVTDIAGDIPSVLKGDETRIRQILYNLLSNAAKYTEKGLITFTVRWNPETSRMYMSVRDTGRGIRKQDMDRLFESFDRLDEHANKAIEGTGLGLTITKRIVELMGGELRVESIYGEGSCFSFEIVQEVVDATPIAEELENGSRKSHHESAVRYFTAQTAKVLVVDDNSFNRTIAKELMKPHKMQVELAASGPECLEMVKKTHYDLIFLDHMMPGMDGIETITNLREMPEYRAYDTPVVAFSANAVSGMREEFRTAGFVDFLSKPIGVENLESMLVNYLPQSKIQRISKEEYELMNKTPRSSSDSGAHGIGFGAGIAEGRNYNAEDSSSANEAVYTPAPSEYHEYDPSLVNIDGLNIEVGLESVGGDIEDFFNIAEVIVSDHNSMRDRLEREFDDKDIENYTIDIHALKSNMATIGATDLSAMAKRLEMAGRAGNSDYIGMTGVAAEKDEVSNHEQCMAEYERIVDELSASIDAHKKWMEEMDNTAPADAPSGTEAELALQLKKRERTIADLMEGKPEDRDCLYCLKLLLDECEYDTAIRLAGLFSKLSGDSGERSMVDAVADKLSMFDYEGAEALIEDKLK